VLGWGGLDKDVYFFVEDEDDKPLLLVGVKVGVRFKRLICRF
jgi:hypothetical protein